MANYNYSYSHSYDAYEAYANPYAEYANTSPTRTHARIPASRTVSTQKELRRVDEADVVIGRIFWLPPQEELPPRAVRRAHGKGSVEEGIYNHPVVVVSRPAEEPQVVHFQIVSLPLRHFKKTVCLPELRSHRSRVNAYMKYTPKATNSMLHGARGIFQYHPLQLTQMLLPKRCKSDFPPWTCNMARRCAGTRMSTSDTSTR
jgi:hypothetical protein